MANTLKIRVDVTADNQTESQYTMAINDKIKFQNAHKTGALEVKVKSGNTPFCKGNNEEVPVITVPADSTSEAYHICNNFNPDQFAYQATIAGAVTEDPIVIIEKSSAGGSMMLTTTVIATVVALVVGYLLGRNLKTRSRPDRA